jgi:hypothetical protein
LIFDAVIVPLSVIVPALALSVTLGSATFPVTVLRFVLDGKQKIEVPKSGSTSDVSKSQDTGALVEPPAADAPPTAELPPTALVVPPTEAPPAVV